MARVRALPAIVHTSYGHAPGDVVELRDDIAGTWCAAGLAEPVETPEDQAAAEKPEDTAGAETPEASGEEPETTSARPRASRKLK